MHIMTTDGWKQLSPREFIKPGHTPSMLERMGIDENYNAIKAMAEYARGDRKGAYFTYCDDGTFYQSLPAINPLPGMYGKDQED